LPPGAVRAFDPVALRRAPVQDKVNATHCLKLRTRTARTRKMRTRSSVKIWDQGCSACLRQRPLPVGRHEDNYALLRNSWEPSGRIGNYCASIIVPTSPRLSVQLLKLISMLLGRVPYLGKVIAPERARWPQPAPLAREVCGRPRGAQRGPQRGGHKD
jgi:hypothetical protein